MTSKERLLKALSREKTDRLPVTTHHVMPYFLNKYFGGGTIRNFFDQMGLDPIHWEWKHRPDVAAGCFSSPFPENPGFLEPRLIASPEWIISMESRQTEHGLETMYAFSTPRGRLSMKLQSNEYTSWVTEHLIKRKRDIDLIADFAPAPLCDKDSINAAAEYYGDGAMIRGHICCFDVFGQPGCWQDACCLYGTEKMIMESYDDPGWVHELLGILQKRKLKYIGSLDGARFDLIELGGGDASTSVISPAIFNNFVAPYDSTLIRAAHEVGQRIVYHTCGGMMPILEDIVAMGPDAMETFTPVALGGDTDLARAKKTIGDRVCMIGGFNQAEYFGRASESETRAAVRRCFEEAGEGGGYILSPSDHFFDADIELIKTFADEARRCEY